MPTHKPRVVAALLAIVVLSSRCFAAASDGARLKALYDAHRWFELRDAVAKGNAPLFYQGAVACAWNDLHRCAKKLAGVIKSRPQSDEALQAHRLLTYAYLRQGKYRGALAQADAVLALKPSDSEVQGDRPLLAVLSEFPEQEVAHGHVTTLKMQEAGLPIAINGVPATYWIDTGANLSALSESEAKRYGLRILSAPVKIGDVTGTEFESRVAVADEVSIGPIRLKHVAFLVLSSQQPPFDQSPPGEGGLIGLPVLLALQKFSWGADKTFEIGAKSANKTVSHADLCFDGQHPVAQVQYEGGRLAFTLDTGATNTDLYPPFAEMFPELMRGAAKTDSYKMEGAGGAKTLNAAVLPSLPLDIGGFPVVLKPAGILREFTVENSKFFHGNLGIDLLQQARKTTFDFRAMTLTLE
ncbi:MAG TPA: aspartyl protease family protein [Candidatus Sulfotelmatobacter sp.]